MTTPTPAPTLVPIDTFQDILNALERHPPLREALRLHLLGEEFLRLPEIVANLAATVEQILGVITAMSERQARTEADVAELKEGQAALTTRVANLEETAAETQGAVARLEETVAEMQGTVAETQGTVARLEETVTEMQGTVARLDETVTETQGTVARLDKTVTEIQGTVARLDETMTEVQSNISTMRGTLNRLDGTDYERTAARRIRRSGGRRLGLTRPVIVQSRTLPESDIIPSLLDNAIDDGLISEEQADEVDYADIIARGQDTNGVLTYVVVEVSITVAPHDVTRARARADLLAQATGAPVLAAAVGTEITDDASSAAQQSRVTYIPIPMPE